MTHRLVLRPYAVDDFPVLLAANSPGMTDHLGGPESSEALARRHERYVRGEQRLASGGMFTSRLVRHDGDPGVPVGMVGYWEREWLGEEVYETGWGVLPSYQGRGFAVAAVRLVLDHAREHGRRDTVHAYPSLDHAASNAVARAAGFELAGVHDVEYPPGNPLRSNDWVAVLR